RWRIDLPRAVELHQREDELLNEHGDEWGVVTSLLGPFDFGPMFRRGFPAYAALSLDTFLARGEELFGACPTLHEVCLYGVADRCEELAGCPALANVDTLEIADWPTRTDAEALVASPYLERVPQFKLWLGGEPWLLNEMVRRATASLRDITLVQLCGGLMCPTALVASQLNEAADALARDANGRLGRDVVRVTRPFERLFPLDGDLGYNLCAGRLPNGKPALAAGSYADWLLVTFDADGRPEAVETRSSPVPRTKSLNAAFTEWVDGELQLELGLIWVREFGAGDLSVLLWDSTSHDRIADPSFPTTDAWAAQERYTDGGEVRHWLERGNFVINWYNDYWADWRGTIHSS
ncbi:MAG: hypothetical protein K2V38_05110, partial [Gemmataceae bacterium]|nr:hypothetical protein [Gemmataceae bacterium]